MWERIAWFLPKKLVYWAVVRAFAKASCTTCSHKHPDEIGYNDVAKVWES
jgi:hypothetical protein